MPANAPQPVIEAALKLAAEKGWRDLALADIAEAAGLSIGALYAQYPSKSAILAAYSRDIDTAVLAETDGDQAGESPKDRLFDLLMRRFDKLDGHKAGLLRIAEDTGRDPLSLVCSLANLERSMAAMLEAAGLSTTGLAGRPANQRPVSGLSRWLAGLVPGRQRRQGQDHGRPRQGAGPGRAHGQRLPRPEKTRCGMNIT